MQVVFRRVLLSLLLGVLTVLPEALGDCISVQYSVKDPARQNHQSNFLLYYPAPSTSMVPAPVISFAHGFGLEPSRYDYIASLCDKVGYFVFFPANLGVLPSTKNLAIDQTWILEHALQQSMSNASSIFYKRVKNSTGTMGHSLGGGSSILAADPTILNGLYTAPQVVTTLSLGVYTLPAALPSAARISASTPILLMTATQDCIDPPEKNSIPVYTDLASKCKTLLTIIGGTHCQYADEDAGCAMTEFNCGANATITRETQFMRTTDVLSAWFKYALEGRTSEALSAFQSLLTGAAARNWWTVLESDWSGC